MANIVNVGNPNVIIQSENSEDLISDEVKAYVADRTGIQKLDKQFWDDFVFGASLWGITAGYTGPEEGTVL